MNRIPLSYNEIDSAGLHRILKSYEGRDHHQLIVDFENRIAALAGVPHVAALQSGTAALHLALKVVGVSAGDCVMVPTFTYVATVSPVTYLGAQPVLIDSERVTWNMDPQLLDQGLSNALNAGKKVGAIIVVHNYGLPAQMASILAISKKWNIPVIEDAAESFGSKIDGRWTGTLADIGIFSFNNNKTITSFGGGALISSTKSQAQILTAFHLSANFGSCRNRYMMSHN